MESQGMSSTKLDSYITKRLPEIEDNQHLETHSPCGLGSTKLEIWKKAKGWRLAGNWKDKEMTTRQRKAKVTNRQNNWKAHGEVATRKMQQDRRDKDSAVKDWRQKLWDKEAETKNRDRKLRWEEDVMKCKR